MVSLGMLGADLLEPVQVCPPDCALGVCIQRGQGVDPAHDVGQYWRQSGVASER